MAKTRAQQAVSDSPLKEPLERDPPRPPRSRAASAAPAAGPSTSIATVNNGGTTRKKKESSNKSQAQSEVSRFIQNTLDGTILEEPAEAEAKAEAIQEASNTGASNHLPKTPSPEARELSPELSSTFPPSLQARQPTPELQDSSPSSLPTPEALRYLWDTPLADCPRSRAVGLKTRRKAVASNSQSEGSHESSPNSTHAEIIARRKAGKKRAPNSDTMCQKHQLKLVLICTCCHKEALECANGTKLTFDVPATEKRSRAESDADAMPPGKRLRLEGNNCLSRPPQVPESSRNRRPAPVASRKAPIDGRALIQSVINPAPDSFRGHPGLQFGIRPSDLAKKKAEAQEKTVDTREGETQVANGDSSFTPAPTGQGASQLHTDDTTNTETQTSANQDTPTRPGLFGKLASSISRGVSQFFPFSPAKNERPIAQPRRSRATVESPQASAPVPNTTDAIAAASGSTLSVSTGLSNDAKAPLTLEQIVSHRANTRPKRDQNTVNHPLHIPPRFQHRPPTFISFATPQEYEADQQKARAEARAEERQKAREHQKWVHDYMVDRREEAANIGVKRKRGHHVVHIPWENFVEGRTEDGKGFEANVDLVVPSDEELPPGRQLYPVSYYDSASTPEPSPQHLSDSDRASKRAKIAEDYAAWTDDDGVRHLPGGSEVFPDGTVIQGIKFGGTMISSRLIKSPPKSFQRTTASQKAYNEHLNREAASMAQETAARSAALDPDRKKPFTCPSSPLSSDEDEPDPILPSDSGTTTIDSGIFTSSPAFGAPTTSTRPVTPRSYHATVEEEEEEEERYSPTPATTTEPPLQWTQSPPSAPTPAHASLPSDETGHYGENEIPNESGLSPEALAAMTANLVSELSGPKENGDVDIQRELAIAKQKAMLEKHKPKNPSSLRQQRTFDSPNSPLTRLEISSQQGSGIVKQRLKLSQPKPPVLTLEAQPEHHKVDDVRRALANITSRTSDTDVSRDGLTEISKLRRDNDWVWEEQILEFAKATTNPTSDLDHIFADAESRVGSGAITPQTQAQIGVRLRYPGIAAYAQAQIDADFENEVFVETEARIRAQMEWQRTLDALFVDPNDTTDEEILFIDPNETEDTTDEEEDLMESDAARTIRKLQELQANNPDKCVVI